MSRDSVPQTVPTGGRAPSGRTTNRRAIARVGAAVLLLHVVAFGLLFGAVLPAGLTVGGQVFGIGLATTAYVLGLRHAFDADHIAAIDNTTRKFTAEGRRTVSVGFWFALGHSAVVLVLAVLVVVATRAVGALTSDDSATHRILGIAGTSVSGLFLYLIGLLNLVALVGIVRSLRDLRAGRLDETRLEAHLQSRGALNRVLGGLTRSIRHPWQMFPVGLLFGLGFDTASEVTLLVLAGTGAAAGLPWYAIVALPLLFAAGMTALDTADGVFMNYAYDWAFANPLRKIYYNVTITGLSVVVALLIGTIELVTVLHDDVGMDDPVTAWVASLSLDDVGFLVAGLFVVVWAAAVGYWRLGRVEQRWGPPAAAVSPEERN